MSSWLLTPEFSAIGTVASLVGLVVTAVGFGITWWKGKQLLEGMARKVLADQASELQRLLRSIRTLCESARWEQAFVRCEDAQFLADRLPGNPYMNEEEMIQIRDGALNLRQIRDYLLNRKLRADAPSESFDPPKKRFLEQMLQTVGTLIRRLEQQTWRRF